MSASEKLRALNDATPLEKYEIDLFSFLPQIVAVVKAAEEAARYDYCDEDEGAGMCSSSDGEFAEWQDIGDALAALYDALVSAES